MQRKRSLDEEHNVERFDGPTVILRGHPTRGIPTDSTIRIATMEGSIIKEDIASKQYSLTVDPGRYIYSIRKHYVGTKRGFRYVGEFMVGITEKQWQTMEYMEPQFSRARQTTRGPRWVCNALGCGNASISKISAMEHEASHKGMSFLQAVDAKAVEQEMQEAVPTIQMDKTPPPKSQAEGAGVRTGPLPGKQGKAGDWTTNVPGVSGS